MIWVDDLAVLEPALLRDGIHLRENEISPERLALALSRCCESTRNHVLTHVDPDYSDAARRAQSQATHADPDSILAAELDLIAIYLWAIVYRKYPHQYEAFVSHQHYRFDRLFPSSMFANAMVLEIGCGTGKLLDHLATAAGRLFAIDPLISVLRVARAKHREDENVHFAAGSFGDIPFADGSMDFVVSNMAFQFHDRGGGTGGLDSMKRVLKPGGKIRLTVESTRTQKFLLANGFEEEFVPLGLCYEQVVGIIEPLVQFLLTVAENGWKGSAAANRGRSKGRARRIIAGLLAVIEGAPWRAAFHNGRFLDPAGLPAYEWRKPEKAVEAVTQ